MVKLNWIDGKKAERFKCTLMSHSHYAQEYESSYILHPNVVYIDTQQLVSLSAAKKHIVLVQDQSVHQVSLWQHFTSKIPLRYEKTPSSLGHLTLVAGGGP